MNDLRSQLAPGWSGVNIALMVVLFVLAWPLGLVMIGYIVWGRQLGIDFGRPETLSAFGARLGHAWRAGSASWGSERTISTGTPAAGTPDRGTPNAAADRPRADKVRAGGDTATTDETLRREREILARERQAFEAEKREWRERREPLDS